MDSRIFFCHKFFFSPQKLVNDYLQLCVPFLYFCCISGKEVFLALFGPEGMMALQGICSHILLCYHREYFSCHNQSSSRVQHLSHEAKGAKRCHMMTSGCLNSPSPMLRQVRISCVHVCVCARVCRFVCVSCPRSVSHTLWISAPHKQYKISCLSSGLVNLFFSFILFPWWKAALVKNGFLGVRWVAILP